MWHVCTGGCARPAIFRKCSQKVSQTTAVQKSEASTAKGMMLNVLLSEEQRGPELLHALTEHSEQGLTVLGQCVAWGFHDTVSRLLKAIRLAADSSAIPDC
jgi:hypothetical protein